MVLFVGLSQSPCFPAETTDSATLPKRLKRQDSFLGIHFDFHAGADCTQIGKNTTPAMVNNIIDLVHPDYLQIDCKGHPGLSSYPTKIGNQAPGFVGDPLRVWRDATAKRGVALYMHYSGVWDSEAIRRHPDWAVVNADGKPNPNATSFFGPYADQLLVPQLRELAGDYHVDGAWIDGECWASVVDYSEPALKAFREATSIQDVPRKPTDPHWFEFISFNREAFRRYLRHYIAEVKKTNPEMQLCSNWAFSDHMPEPVSAPLDFLSGDYSPEDSVNSARFSARCLARQGKPWDLMAWSFTHHNGKKGSNQKPAIQLQREAALVLVLCGSCQAYIQQTRDGAIHEERMPVMAEVAAFCRARQAVCHHAVQVPQVALLYSGAAHYRNSPALFGPWGGDVDALKGALQALLESQNSVEILGEHHLTGHMADYPLIVVPEWEYLEPRFKHELVTFVKGGGSLMLIGPKTAAMFQSELGVTLDPAPMGSADQRFTHNGQAVTIHGLAQVAKLSSNAKPFGLFDRTAEQGASPPPAASITKLGRGKIAATYFTFGQGYLATHASAARNFLNELVRELFPEPIVEVKGSSDVDVVVNRLGRKLEVNLVNTSGPHTDTKDPIFESVAPIGPLSVAVRLANRPHKVTLEPGARPLAFDYRSGQIHVTLPGVDIHDIIVVE